MKKAFLLTAILFLVTVTNSFSQYGLSKGRVNSVFDANWKGWNCDIVTSSCGAHNNAYTGTIMVNLGGVPNTPFYCLDLCTNIQLGDSIVDSASTIPEAIYITNNYYPAKPSVLANDSSEACAVQLAIWHFRNGVVISTTSVDGTTDDAIIRARAQTIIDETIANSGTAVIDPTLEIKPSVDPDDFYIRTLDTAGNPVAVSNIALSISGGGSLSHTTVSTVLPTGTSPDVTVTGANEGSIITATATVEIPSGITYCGLNAIKQLLVLGRTTTGLRTTTTTWGALPVELSSFTANVINRDVTLNWSTATEINNSSFQIERKSFSSNEWSVIGNIAGNGTSNISHEYSYSDRNLISGIYTYRLKQIDFNGNFEYHNLNGEVMIGTPTEFKLSQNYPNPFNPSTTINFDIPKEGFVSLKVFNTSGKEVASLVNETRSAGYHSVNFNASALSSGVYYYRLESNGITKTMKMALIK